MTDIRPSPEMLDAAAANRAAPLEDRDLSAAIELHRDLYQVETGILKLHQRDGDSGIGPPFSAPFAAFLDERYGGFPWHRALMYLRWAVCRKTHPEHLEREEFGGSLCHRFVSLVVRNEYSIDMARLQLGLSNEGRSRRVLDSALLVIERKLEVMLSEDKAKQSYERPASEWMLAPHEHRHPPQTSLEDCPQCARAA